MSYFTMLIIQVIVAYNGFPWKNEKRVTYNSFYNKAK